MEPTRIKPGHTLPVPADPVQPEAYQRAPTLMAGKTAGSQGEVRVWVPQRRLLWMSMLGGICVFTLGLLHLFPPARVIDYWSAAGSLFWGIALVAPGLINLMHPCSISADDAGIAITTAKENQAFRWNQIQAFQHHKHNRYRRIDLILPEGKVKVDLSGYPKPVQEEILSLVTRKVKQQGQLSEPSLRSCP